MGCWGRVGFEVSLATAEEVGSGEVEIEDQGLVSSNIAILIRDTLTYIGESKSRSALSTEG